MKSRFYLKCAVISLYFLILNMVCLLSQEPEWIVYSGIHSELAGTISSIAVDEDGIVWVANGYLARFDGVNCMQYTCNNTPLPYGCNIRLVDIASKDNVWLKTNGVLANYTMTNWKLYDTSNSELPGEYMDALTVENPNSVWVGSYTYPQAGGVANYVKAAGWFIYTPENSGLPGNFVKSITLEDNGTAWIGTTAGLAVYDGYNWEVYNTNNSQIPGNHITKITIDNDDNKWIATRYNGLAKFDGTNWTIYDEDLMGMPNNYVMDIAIEEDNTVWIATYGGGIARYNGQKWQSWSSSFYPLPSDNCIQIEIDSNNNKWIGTYQKGLCVFKEGGIDIPEIQTDLIFADGFENDFEHWDNYDNNGDEEGWTTQDNPLNNHSGTKSAMIDIAEGPADDLIVTKVTAIPDVLPADAFIILTFFLKSGETGTNEKKDSKSHILNSDAKLYVKLSTEGNRPEDFDITLGEISDFLTTWRRFSFDLNPYAGQKVFIALHAVSDEGISIAIDDCEISASTGSATSAEEDRASVRESIIHELSPNPFSESSVISYQLSEAEPVKIEVYNSMGEKISTLVDEYKDAGEHSAVFNASGLPQGMYYYTIMIGDKTYSGKMLLVR